MAQTPDSCPNCGAELPRNAKSCPQCGSDEKTGWSDDAVVQGLGLPDEEFNYDEFVESEFGESSRVRPRGVAWYWWLVAVAILAGFITMLLWR